MRRLLTALTLVVITFAIRARPARAQERLPQQVAGTWRIARILPIEGKACWTATEAQPLVGSLLSYSAHEMRWRGGSVPLTGITTRSVTSKDFAEETSGGSTALKLTDLGIHSRGVLEVNMQHDDADITGSTTEVPGDSVLVAGPNRIIVSACGIYFEAHRLAPHPSAAPETTRKGL